MKMLHEGLVWKIRTGGASPLRGPAPGVRIGISQGKLFGGTVPPNNTLFGGTVRQITHYLAEQFRQIAEHLILTDHISYK